MGRQGALVRVITGGAAAVLRQQVDACRGLAYGCYRNFASLPAEASVEAPLNSKDGKVSLTMFAYGRIPGRFDGEP